VTPRAARTTIALALAAATIALYAQTVHNGFVEYDDGPFVRDNPFVREGLSAISLRWALTAHLTFDGWPYLDYWQPVTVLSRLVDAELFGLDARGPHAVNVLFQALNAALLFLVLESLTRAAGDGPAVGRSAFVAALWTLHPLRVESVAWITERKDMLSGLFWLATLAAYHRYVRRPGGGRLALVAGSFSLAVMSKPMAVTLPFVLLLLDYWPLKRVGWQNGWRGAGRLVVEKLPLLAITAAVTAIGIRAQARAGTLNTLGAEPLSERIAGAIVDYARYAWRLAWPYPMALPRPDSPAWGAGTVAACAAVLAAVTLVAAAQAKRRPFLLVGWLWFVGVLVPISGIVQPGKIPLTDRYTYLPHIGLLVALAWGLHSVLPAMLRVPRVLVPAAAAVLVASATASAAQLRHWTDSVTLFRHAVDAIADNYPAHLNLANALTRLGRADEAEEQHRRANALRPAQVHYLRGNALTTRGRLDEALAEFTEAVRLDPDLVDARNNRGVLLARQGRNAEARHEYQEALVHRPRHADALYNLARLDASEGRADAALAGLDAALNANPSLAGAFSLRGNLRAAAGRLTEAEADFRAVVRLSPASPDAHNNLGRALALQGKTTAARAAYEAALRLDPGHVLARANLAELGAR
jgi:protein O-mannosyl-transferase